MIVVGIVDKDAEVPPVVTREDIVADASDALRQLFMLATPSASLGAGKRGPSGMI
jgi:hypothetical protein